MSINKFIGIGNITRDAESRPVGQGQVLKFGIAMNERYKKQDGTIAETTEFASIEYWGNANVAPYLTKGQLVYVEGSLRTEKWTGNDGQERSTTKIRANNVQLLGPRTQPQPAQPSAPRPTYAQPQAAPQYGPAPQYAQPSPAPQYAQPSAAPQYPQPQYQPAAADSDPDLPF